jgi:hypothetical protein
MNEVSDFSDCIIEIGGIQPLVSDWPITIRLHDLGSRSDITKSMDGPIDIVHSDSISIIIRLQMRDGFIRLRDDWISYCDRIDFRFDEYPIVDFQGDPLVIQRFVQNCLGRLRRTSISQFR